MLSRAPDEEGAMTMRPHGGARGWASLAALLALLFAAAGASEQEPAAPAPAAPEASSDVDPDALALAKHAFDYLRAQQRFSFHAETGYEVVQKDGEKLEFGAARTF